MTQTLTDVTRAVTAQHCPRKRFLNFHLYGHGIERTQVEVTWATKHYIRLGVFYLLRGVSVETAVDVATRSYLALCSTRGLFVGPQENAYDVAMEQKALIEAAIRGFYLERYTELTREYEIVAVEDEHVWDIADSLVWMWKADAVLRAGETISLLRIHVVDYVDEQTKIRDSHAMRAIADPAACVHKFSSNTGRVPETRIEYIAVGRRHQGGHKSPLIRGYIHRVGQRLAPKRELTDPRTGAKRRLGNEWMPFSAWQSDRITLPEWVAFVGQQGVLAELYGSVIINPPSEQEVSEWRESVTAQEANLRDLAESVYTTELDRQAVERLAWWFPMYRHSCDAPGVCPFQGICFGEVAITDPLAGGVYQMRHPEFQAELTQIEEVSQ